MNSKVKFLLVIVVSLVVIIGAVYALKVMEGQQNNTSNTVGKSNVSARPSNGNQNNENQNNETNNTDSNLIDFTVYNRKGEEVKLSDFRGKPVVINVWSVTCIFCIEEMPYFEDSYKANSDVEFLMIAPTYGKEENREVTKEYIDQNKYTFNIYFDDTNEMTKKLKVTGFPTTYFVNKEGKFVKTHIGSISDTKLQSYINQIK